MKWCSLVSNAVKFSPSGSEVSVHLESDAEFIIVSVRDLGPGIPENEHDRIFKPFRRTSVRATGNEKCTGLGHAIVKNVIEAHEGNHFYKPARGGLSFYF